MNASLTRSEIDLLQSLTDWQALGWYLELYRRNPAAAIDARLAVGMPLPDGVFDGFTKEQTAQFFGLRTETIDGLVRNGMPIQRRGRRPGGVGRHQRSGFNLQDCAEWLADQRTRKLTRDVESEQIAAADLVYRQEKSRMQELRRRQLEGQLIDVDVWSARIASAMEAIRRGVESLHRSFGDDVVEALTRLIDEIEGQFLGEEEDADADEDETTECGGST